MREQQNIYSGMPLTYKKHKKPEGYKTPKSLTVIFVPNNGKRMLSFQTSNIMIISLVCLGVVAMILSFFWGTRLLFSSRHNAELTAQIQAVQEQNANFSKDLEYVDSLVVELTDALQSTGDYLNIDALTSDNNAIDTTILSEGDFSYFGEYQFVSEDENSGEFLTAKLAKELESQLPLIKGVNEALGTQNKLYRSLPVFWPVPNGRVSMEWGPNVHPIFGYWYVHKGIDISAITGTPVMSTADGVVRSIGLDPSGYGLHIYVEHNYGFVSHYSHLSRIRVSKGQVVKQGQIIGDVGSTGLTTGPHLDFQLYLGTNLVDPGIYLQAFNRYNRPRGTR